MALSIRLCITEISRASLPLTIAGPLQVPVIVRPFWAAASVLSAIASETMSDRSTSVRAMAVLPSSRRVMADTSANRLCSLWQEARLRRRKSLRCAASISGCAKSVSMHRAMEATGVLSSWLMLLVSSRLMRIFLAPASARRGVRGRGL